MVSTIETKDKALTQVTASLAQTESDLASAILLIQEREAEIANLKKEQAETAEAVVEFIQELPLPQTNQFALTDDDADNSGTTHHVARADFGNQFPANPDRGDLYLRVDMLPNKLFRWNGKKWIEIDRSSTDRFVYLESYLTHLSNQIQRGEIEWEDLTASEDQELRKYLDQKISIAMDEHKGTLKSRN